MKPTTKHIAGIIFAIFMLTACPRIALAEGNAPPFMQVGKMYSTFKTTDMTGPFRFIVLDLGKDGWVKIRVIPEDPQDNPKQDGKVWLN